MKPIKLEFTDKEVTPWAEMALLGKMLHSVDFDRVIQDLPLPGQGSNRGYSPEQVLVQFLVSVWCGANCFENLEVTRNDEVIKKVFGWERMAGHRAIKRYFESLTRRPTNAYSNPCISGFLGSSSLTTIRSILILRC